MYLVTMDIEFSDITAPCLYLFGIYMYLLTYSSWCLDNGHQYNYMYCHFITISCLTGSAVQPLHMLIVQDFPSSIKFTQCQC